MRILIVYPRFFIDGGAERLVVRLCNHLTGSGCTVALLTTAMLPGIQDQLNQTEVITAALPPQGKLRGGRGLVRRQIDALGKALLDRQHDVDVINIHNFPAELAIEGATRPVVWMCNEPELFLRVKRDAFRLRSFSSKRFYKALLKREKEIVRSRITTTVVADQGNADRFQAIYGIKPEIVSYGIDHDFFSQPPDDAPIPGLPDTTGRFVILHVGMLTPYKNQMASLKALATLRKKLPQALLVLAGSSQDGRYQKKLARFMARHGLDDHVIFTGHINRSQLRTLYGAAHVLLHPIKPQGGWLSPFECLSAGTPIIVSEAMTAGPLITREKIGCVTDDYAKALADAHQNYAQHQAMAEKGQRFVGDHLTWPAFSGNMLDIFRKAAAECASPRPDDPDRESLKVDSP